MAESETPTDFMPANLLAERFHQASGEAAQMKAADSSRKSAALLICWFLLQVIYRLDDIAHAVGGRRGARF